jgi:hypothetical protein
MPIGGITRHKEYKFQGLTWKSGYFYSFKYKAWQNDKKPSIIFMYAFSGYHPNTGREWRFFQAINLSYVPRSVRKKFLKDYLKIRDRRKGKMSFVWRDVQTKYPGLRIGIRRYFYSPANYIINPEEIPFDEAESFVMGTMLKDYSKKVIRSLRARIRDSRKKRAKAKREKKARRREAKKKAKK